jgi:molybdate transport system ATP-binding protein
LQIKFFIKGSVEYNIHRPYIIFVEQHYYFKTLSNTNDFYYQQRYNSLDNNDALTVTDELLKISADSNEIMLLLEHLQLSHRKNDSLLHLSSGEHKRFQLIKAFLLHADVFIFDSPFTGLDINSRKILRSIIDEKAKSSTIIVIADVEDAPTCITHVAELENGNLKCFEEVVHFRKHYSPFTIHYSPLTTHHSPLTGNIPVQENIVEFNVTVRLEDVSVIYGDKKILSNISWQINCGEKWLLKALMAQANQL